MQRIFYVYIMTTINNKLFYIGVTGDLEGRVWQHKNKSIKGFTSKYNINKLVYYEEFEYVHNAIQREKQLKNWHRQWKINLIKEHNPAMEDLAHDWFDRDGNC